MGAPSAALAGTAGLAVSPAAGLAVSHSFRSRKNPLRAWPALCRALTYVICVWLLGAPAGMLPAMRSG
jgi:hypothetical protein